MPNRLDGVDFLLLLALSEDDRHGAGLKRRVLELSQGEVQLWPVRLYSALESLRERGLIVELDEEERPANASQRRRYYRITPLGRSQLASEASRLANLVQRVGAQLGQEENP